MRNFTQYHDPLEMASVALISVPTQINGLVFGRKRRTLSSVCTFVHGLGLFLVGTYYLALPAESLAMVADAWGVELEADPRAATFALARNMTAVAAVYLAAWGLTCCCLATTAAPRTKRLVALLNLCACAGVALCSAFHPEAAAAARCREDRAAGVACFKIAAAWHAPFVVLDILGILFADAGPRLVRLDATSAILIDGKVPEVRNSRVTKLDSRADLVEYANADALDAHAALVPPGSERELKKYSYIAAGYKKRT